MFGVILPDKYHTDWSPKGENDVNIIKKILHADYDVNDKRWKNASTWSWDEREAILYLPNGSLVAVGVHFRPHGTLVGGSKAKSLVNASQEDDETGRKPLGGYMCMYFGDSRNDLNKKADPENRYNDAARDAKIRADSMANQKNIQNIISGVENVMASISRSIKSIIDGNRLIRRTEK